MSTSRDGAPRFVSSRHRAGAIVLGGALGLLACETPPGADEIDAVSGGLTLSTIQLAATSVVSLTAPRVGDMSGMLFFEDRDVLFKFPHIIASNNARNLVGTIYLPGNTLQINSTDPIADQSDYTVIIARKFEMKDGPELVLNTDYEHSPIPVPDGVGNKARPIVRLAKGG